MEIQTQRAVDGDHLDQCADLCRHSVGPAVARRRGDQRLGRRTEGADRRFEDGARARGHDDTVGLDVVDVGDRRYQIVRVVGRISPPRPLRNRTVQCLDRLRARPPGVLIRADPDDAVIIGHLLRPGLELLRLQATADDERAGQHSGRTQADRLSEPATCQ